MNISTTTAVSSGSITCATASLIQSDQTSERGDAHMRVQGKILSITVIILLFVLLTGCGKKEVQTPWDVQEIWNAVSAEEDFPEMIPVPENRLGYMFGIEQKDYTQEVIAVSADSLRADEIWLIEAVDEAAAAVRQFAVGLGRVPHALLLERVGARAVPLHALQQRELADPRA